MTNIRFLRTFNNMSCRELSVLSGVSIGVIYKLEVNRKKLFPLEHLIKLCHAFNIDLSSIMFDDLRSYEDERIRL